MVCHLLAVDPSPKQMAQRKWEIGDEKISTIDEEVGKISSIDFIMETEYPTWLTNMVLVRKEANKWIMCVGFINLNTACSKDPYPLSNIDLFIYSFLSYHTLSFMDSYS